MRKYLVAAMIVAIVIAHVFLWRSDMATSLNLSFTIINGVAWTIVLAPILLIDRWLAATKRRNADEHDNVT
jgi:hypothetical protein